MIKNYKLSWILKISLILVFFAIDLLTKFFLQKHFENGGDVITVIPNFFSLQYVKNEGISFGMFKGNKVASLILPCLFLVIFFIVDFISKPKSVLFGFGFSLIIAGALGNLYDRIILKFVRDFFEISFFPFVFNFADACITIGFALIVLYLLLETISDAKSKKNNKDKDLNNNKDLNSSNLNENNVNDVSLNLKDETFNKKNNSQNNLNLNTDNSHTTTSS